MEECANGNDSITVNSEVVDKQKLIVAAKSINEELLKNTLKKLKDVFEKDKLLNRLPYDITLDEINSEIATIKGQWITVYVDRIELEPFKIVVPESRTTVLELKKAIQKHYETKQWRLRNRKLYGPIDTAIKPGTSIDNTTISWRYIWRTYVLSFDGQLLSNDNELLKTHGIKNKSTLKFIKKKGARTKKQSASSIN